MSIFKILCKCSQLADKFISRSSAAKESETLDFLSRRSWKELRIDVPKFSCAANENSFPNAHASAHHEKPLLSHWLGRGHMITLSCKGVWNLAKASRIGFGAGTLSSRTQLRVCWQRGG